MRSLAGDLSGAPFVSCTDTRLRGACSTTAIRYCSGFSASSLRQNASLESQLWSRLPISVSGSA